MNLRLLHSQKIPNVLLRFTFSHYITTLLAITVTGSLSEDYNFVMQYTQG